MRRTDRYVDTDVFHYYNANPKGKYTSDCVIRALSTALDCSYESVLQELQKIQLATGYDSGDQKAYNKFLSAHGWVKMPQPKKDNNKKYSATEWCKFIQYWNNPKYNRIIAHIGSGHIAAIIDGKVFDTWDSSDGCIGNYWVKEI